MGCSRAPPSLARRYTDSAELARSHLPHWTYRRYQETTCRATFCKTCYHNVGIDYIVVGINICAVVILSCCLFSPIGRYLTLTTFALQGGRYIYKKKIIFLPLIPCPWLILFSFILFTSSYRYFLPSLSSLIPISCLPPLPYSFYCFQQFLSWKYWGKNHNVYVWIHL